MWRILPRLLLLTLLLGGLLAWTRIPTLPLPTWSLFDVTAPDNPRHPLNRNLVAHWQVLPQTNQAGSVWRSTAPLVGPLLGTLTNMLPTSTASGWNRTGRPGGFGEMRFDAIDDYVDLGVNILGARLHGAAGITVSAWVSYASLTGAPGAGANIFVNLAMGADGTLIRLGFAGDLTPGAVKVVGRSATGDSNQVLEGTVVLAASTWHHIVGVMNFPAQTLALYIDGVLDVSMGTTFGSATYANTAASIPDILGANAVGTYEFAGALDDVRILARALSAAEVTALYDATRTLHNPMLQWLPHLVAQPSGVLAFKPRRGSAY